MDELTFTRLVPAGAGILSFTSVARLQLQADWTRFLRSAMTNKVGWISNEYLINESGKSPSLRHASAR